MKVPRSSRCASSSHEFAGVDPPMRAARRAVAIRNILERLITWFSPPPIARYLLSRTGRRAGAHVLGTPWESKRIESCNRVTEFIAAKASSSRPGQYTPEGILIDRQSRVIRPTKTLSPLRKEAQSGSEMASPRETQHCPSGLTATPPIWVGSWSAGPISGPERLSGMPPQPIEPAPSVTVIQSGHGETRLGQPTRLARVGWREAGSKSIKQCLSERTRRRSTWVRSYRHHRELYCRPMRCGKGRGDRVRSKGAGVLADRGSAGERTC
jgi:hypothetical protein